MLRPTVLSLLLAATMPALARAEPIEGTWRLSNGETVTYAACGPAFCSTVNSGRYKGKSVGKMAGTGPAYAGTVVDPSSDKSYDGRAEVSDRKLVLTGCVAKIFCRSQTWTR